MSKSFNQQGQSLIEIIFAITVFTIGIATIGFLVINARVSINHVTDLTSARLLAAEGIEATVSIRDGSFDALAAGTHGLVLEGGYWSLSDNPDNQGKFERTITISNLDADSKEVLSQVTWNSINGKEKSISYNTRLTNWKKISVVEDLPEIID